ncbi:MAG: phosphatase PAP2 family protein [Thermodesulfovibrionales bacterium]|nr:phosphatase PAP2 family protein [Thermodesulfovibrionales bacterium]
MKKIYLRPPEYLTLIFTGFLLVLILIFINQIDRPFYLFTVYLTVMTVQFIRFPVRGWDIAMPFVSVVLLFDSLGYVVHPVNPVDIDPLLLKLDYILTGTYPTVSLQRFTNPLLTEIMQLAYTSYYFIPVVLGIFLKAKKGDEEFQEALFLVLLCFYLSYTGYILFPALGPRFYISHLHTVPLEGLLLMESIHELLNKLEGIKRDAFPSGHTAVALLCLILSYRVSKKFFFFLLPVVVLLIISTVYLRYHYVVDVIAGMMLTIIVLIAGPKLYRLMKGHETPYSNNRR